MVWSLLFPQLKNIRPLILFLSLFIKLNFFCYKCPFSNVIGTAIFYCFSNKNWSMVFLNLVFPPFLWLVFSIVTQPKSLSLCVPFSCGRKNFLIKPGVFSGKNRLQTLVSLQRFIQIFCRNLFCVLLWKNFFQMKAFLLISKSLILSRAVVRPCNMSTESVQYCFAWPCITKRKIVPQWVIFSHRNLAVWRDSACVF